MHHEYRRRVQFLLDEKRRAEKELELDKDIKKRFGWFSRLIIANDNMVNEQACRAMIHAIDIALMKISQHYWWHYTVSGRNPFQFPAELEAEVVSYGLIFQRTRKVTWKYTKFIK